MSRHQQRKAIKYGRPFVDLIARYVEENNIERPDDFVMKSVVNKSGNKVYIIQNTDKKVSLETIAKNKAGVWMKCWKKWKV
jgi:ATP-dependent DNA helicase RecQ